MKRHVELSLRKPKAISAVGAKGFNKEAAEKFCSLLHTILEKYNLTARFTLNVDETVVTIVPKSLFFSRQYMPLLLIFPRKRANPEFLERKPDGAWAEFSPSGWIDGDIFLAWTKRFIKYNGCSKERPMLLLLNGHASRVKNVDVIDLAEANGVIIIYFPPHCTYRMQPLDVGFMNPFSMYYTKEVEKWLRLHPGQTVNLKQVFSRFPNKGFP